jgi:hypothetical protein
MARVRLYDWIKDNFLIKQRFPAVYKVFSEPRKIHAPSWEQARMKFSKQKHSN